MSAIIVLGIPHGALDGEVARAVLRPSLGRLWFPIFSLPYLALAGTVILAWHLFPLWTLGAFLAGSVLHFGGEDAQSSTPYVALLRGGLPIAAPVLAHPVATATILGGIAGVSVDQVPVWLWIASICWLAAVIVRVAQAFAHGEIRSLAGLALPGSVFIVLPPLTAFAIYFVCIHAPAHTEALIRQPTRAPRVTDSRSAWLRAMPLTALTLLIGLALWPFYTGPAPVRLLSLTLQGLAALTLPHMLLDLLVKLEPTTPAAGR